MSKHTATNPSHFIFYLFRLSFSRSLPLTPFLTQTFLVCRDIIVLWHRLVDSRMQMTAMIIICFSFTLRWQWNGSKWMGFSSSAQLNWMRAFAHAHTHMNYQMMIQIKENRWRQAKAKKKSRAFFFGVKCHKCQASKYLKSSFIVSHARNICIYLCVCVCIYNEMSSLNDVTSGSSLAICMLTWQ